MKGCAAGVRVVEDLSAVEGADVVHGQGVARHAPGARTPTTMSSTLKTDGSVGVSLPHPASAIAAAISTPVRPDPHRFLRSPDDPSSVFDAGARRRAAVR